MTQVTTALVSLIPIAGAVALTVQGLRRMKRSRPLPASAAPPRPKEPAAPVSRPRQSQPDTLCAGCGTAVPAQRTRCAICERVHEGQEFSLRTMAVHWLVFLAVMTAIIGAGWLLSP